MGGRGGEECSGFIPGRAQAPYGVPGMEAALEPLSEAPRHPSLTHCLITSDANTKDLRVGEQHGSRDTCAQSSPFIYRDSGGKTCFQGNPESNELRRVTNVDMQKLLTATCMRSLERMTLS